MGRVTQRSCWSFEFYVKTKGKEIAGILNVSCSCNFSSWNLSEKELSVRKQIIDVIMSADFNRVMEKERKEVYRKGKKVKMKVIRGQFNK
jgi:hypothetical protein